MSQQQILAPRMIQSMEILQMAIMDLRERIDHELLENPVLEMKEPDADDPDFEAPDKIDERDPGKKELVINDDSNNELDFDRLDAMSRDWGDSFNEEHRPSRNGIDDDMDRKHDAVQNMGSRPQSLQDYLSDQIGFLDLPENEIRLSSM